MLKSLVLRTAERLKSMSASRSNQINEYFVTHYQIRFD